MLSLVVSSVKLAYLGFLFAGSYFLIIIKNLDYSNCLFLIDSVLEGGYISRNLSISSRLSSWLTYNITCHFFPVLFKFML